MRPTDYCPPWNLPCAWCSWYIHVEARGGHGKYQGAGVEAAELMRDHVEDVHGRTWTDYLQERERQRTLVPWP